MDGKEIFNEILRSPKLKELIGVPIDSEIDETYDDNPKNEVIAIIRYIIDGHLRHTQDENLFKNITKLFDL